MKLQDLNFVGRFNARGISEFADLLRSPLPQILSSVEDLIASTELIEVINAKTIIRPVDSRLQLGEILYNSFNNNENLRKLQSDPGVWSWLA